MTITVVVGGQAGSEGKGAICSEMHRQRRFDYAVRVGGPNAGHTVIDERGTAWPLRQIPVAVVSDPNCELVIAAGSEVDPTVLMAEIRSLEAAGHSVLDRLVVDGEATMMDNQAALAAAESAISTGTTGKGIGAARAARALRGATLVRQAKHLIPGVCVLDTQSMLNQAGRQRREIMIEGTQGYVLGSHAGHYPHSTSGNCRAIDCLAACGFPPQAANVINVLRMHPIRIAGNSGRLTHETTWGQLGVAPEITTVTKKTRRVGLWDWDWAARSVRANGGAIALTFVDYEHPELAGATGARVFGRLPEKLRRFVDEIEVRLEAPVRMLGTGPSSVLHLASAHSGS